MKIFMIDDTLQKQQWLAAIVAYLNNGISDVPFEIGWPIPEEAQKYSQDANAVFNAITHEADAIYLVDLKLLEQEEQGSQLRDLLLATGKDWAVSSCNEFQEVQNDTTNRLRPVFDLYKMASRVLLALKHKHVPTMLVSTQAIGSAIAIVDSKKLTSVCYQMFPDYPINDDTPDEQLLKCKEWAGRILGLLDPIERLARRTGNWFLEKLDAGWRSFEIHGSPHDFPKTATERATAPLESHKKCVTSVFPWLQNVNDWETGNGVAIHESLKTFVGHHADWLNRTGGYALSLAGAYFIFLVALYQKAPNLLIEPYLIKDWSCFFSDASEINAKDCLPFIRMQDQASAGRTLRCLYNFFLQIINKKNDGGFGLSDFLPPSPGKPNFSMKLDWELNEVMDFGDSVGALIVPLVGKPVEVDGGAKMTQNIVLGSAKASEAFLRFVIASQASRKGAGSYGCIWLEANTKEFGWLKVGQRGSVENERG